MVERIKLLHIYTHIHVHKMRINISQYTPIIHIYSISGILHINSDVRPCAIQYSLRNINAIFIFQNLESLHQTKCSTADTVLITDNEIQTSINVLSAICSNLDSLFLLKVQTALVFHKIYTSTFQSQISETLVIDVPGQ